VNAAPTGATSAAPTTGRPWSAWRTAWPWLFWALWGAWLAVSDLRNDEVQGTVLLVLAGAFVLGLARRRAWWAWGVALAAWVPAEPLVTRVTGTAPAWPYNPGVVLAFVPGLLGAGAGARVAGLVQTARFTAP
jgi:hypothetical protein